MTFKKWKSLYKAFQDVFDIELTLTSKRIRYGDLDSHVTQSNEDIVYFD